MDMVARRRTASPWIDRSAEEFARDWPRGLAGAALLGRPDHLVRLRELRAERGHAALGHVARGAEGAGGEQPEHDHDDDEDDRQSVEAAMTIARSYPPA